MYRVYQALSREGPAEGSRARNARRSRASCGWTGRLRRSSMIVRWRKAHSHSRLQAVAGGEVSGGLRGDDCDHAAGGAGGQRVWHRPDAARGRRRFGGRQSCAGDGARDAGRRQARAQVPALDLRCLFTRHRERILAALWPGRRPVADPDAPDLADLSRNLGCSIRRRRQRTEPRRSCGTGRRGSRSGRCRPCGTTSARPSRRLPSRSI